MSELLESVVARAHEILESRHEEMVSSLRGLLQIPSLEADAELNAPFGPECRRALDFVLNLSAKEGLRTVDLEGFAGFAEFGQGDKMVMSLGHVDVVPVGPGWKYPPFGAEVADGYIYARGATDDKGPTITMFYAALALKEAWPDIPVRIRQAFGCNEESGFKCVARYMETEEHPTLGVAPDAMWPLVHAEKGIAGITLTSDPIGKTLRLLSINGGQRSNIVIDHCVAELEIDFDHRPGITAKVNKHWDKNLEYKWDGNKLTLTAVGKAAHGSTPFNGDNAATRILRFLKDSCPTEDQEAYQNFFDLGHPGGQHMGIAGADELTVLTSNLGVITSKDGKVELDFSVRYPVTWTGEQVKAKCLAGLPKGWTLAGFTDSKPLYFPTSHPLVANIVEAYREEKGETLKPETMGGGTYARAVPNCVAIGTSWPGDGLAHETDERVKIEGLYETARIYVRILARLALAAAGESTA